MFIRGEKSNHELHESGCAGYTNFHEVWLSENQFVSIRVSFVSIRGETITTNFTKQASPVSCNSNSCLFVLISCSFVVKQQPRIARIRLRRDTNYHESLYLTILIRAHSCSFRVHSWWNKIHELLETGCAGTQISTKCFPGKLKINSCPFVFHSWFIRGETATTNYTNPAAPEHKFPRSVSPVNWKSIHVYSCSIRVHSWWKKQPRITRIRLRRVHKFPRSVSPVSWKSIRVHSWWNSNHELHESGCAETRIITKACILQF